MSSCICTTHCNNLARTLEFKTANKLLVPDGKVSLEIKQVKISNINHKIRTGRNTYVGKYGSKAIAQYCDPIQLI